MGARVTNGLTPEQQKERLEIVRGEAERAHDRNDRFFKQANKSAIDLATLTVRTVLLIGGAGIALCCTCSAPKKSGSTLYLESGSWLPPGLLGSRARRRGGISLLSARWCWFQLRMRSATCVRIRIRGHIDYQRGP